MKISVPKHKSVVQVPYSLSELGPVYGSFFVAKVQTFSPNRLWHFLHVFDTSCRPPSGRTSTYSEEGASSRRRKIRSNTPWDKWVTVRIRQISKNKKTYFHNRGLQIESPAPFQALWDLPVQSGIEVGFGVWSIRQSSFWQSGAGAWPGPGSFSCSDESDRPKF